MDERIACEAKWGSRCSALGTVGAQLRCSFWVTHALTTRPEVGTKAGGAAADSAQRGARHRAGRRAHPADPRARRAPGAPGARALAEPRATLGRVHPT